MNVNNIKMRESQKDGHIPVRKRDLHAFKSGNVTTERLNRINTRLLPRNVAAMYSDVLDFDIASRAHVNITR